MPTSERVTEVDILHWRNGGVANLPDDVKLLIKPTLAHRIIVTPAARVRAITSTAILDEILQMVPVPNAWVGGGKGR